MSRLGLVIERVGILLAVGILLVLLQGCARELRIPERVSVSVAVACIADEERRELEAACPALRSDAEILELDDYKVIQALRADRGRASTCIAKLRAAVDVCAKVPAAVTSSSGRSAGLGGAGGAPAGADPFRSGGIARRPGSGRP